MKNPRVVENNWGDNTKFETPLNEANPM